MDKFTKEQQVQAIYDLKVGYTLGHADIAMLKSMARQLLASMEHEPEGWQFIGVNGLWVSVTENGMRQALKEGCEVRPLYAAPQLPHPAVLSVPDEIPKLKDGMGFKYVKDGVRYSLNYANGWNACRAAMLQAGNSPVIQDGWQLVPKEPTEAMNKAGWAAMNEHDAINPTYRAMLAAAPQQDVRLALEIGMSRYAGAMQKLVDSGD